MQAIWKRAENPFIHNDRIYSLTNLQKNELKHRKFINDFARKEWESVLLGSSTVNENSLIFYLKKFSDEGRNYTKEEVNDHLATMILGVEEV